MNVEFVEQLKALSNIDIDTHSGSYELVQQTVRFLSNVENSLIDVDDLEMLFHFGNLKHGKAARDRNIQTSNLLEPDKKAIIELNEKISLGNYTNSGLDDSHQSNGNCGLFAKGRQTLKNVVDKSTAQLFIKMLIQISEMQDSSIDEIFNIVEKYLSKPLKGLGAGIASQILHLLKPNIFPILNSVGQKGYKNKIGLPLTNENKVDYYIHNARIIRDFKDKELAGKNYRTIDVALWDLVENDKAEVVPSSDVAVVAETTIAGIHSTTVQYWTYSPGANASFWDEFYAEGIMGIGWDEIDDLSHFHSREEIIHELEESYPEKVTFKNDSLALWDFVSKMKIGDIVYAKLDRTTIIGRGIVTSEYVYEDMRAEYKHTREVEWTHYGEWKLDEPIAMKTLTDFTPYEEWCREMERLICVGDTDELSPYTKENFLSEVYMSSEKYDDIVALLERKKNIILQGAPGVGKSFLAKRLAYSVIGLKDISKVEMVQFHQSYSYEDFIEGFRPNSDGKFTIQKGVFYRFCERAGNDKNPDNRYFFIIDEINRGNLSKIMGELMLLLENDKRGKDFAMPLTYSGKRFYVPENVYVIGMMNTADRSLAMIDYALRRRFSFVPIEPAFDNERFISDFKDCYSEADIVVAKMKALNKLIANGLDSGHQIGHSYFCSDKPLSEKDIYGIFKYEIAELLREYFFDNESELDEAMKLL